MFYLVKSFVVSGAHSLSLPYPSLCTGQHGHNWTVKVYCRSKKLNAQGMIIDFAEIKAKVMSFDHRNLNDLLAQPTAENMARHICEMIPFCYRVDVEETPGSWVTYEI